ncbi:MAG: hypothetical protein H7Y89_20390 [Steroidobacteraceae bacterium]|nr:hypothetical protein [Steroidobacteraceae bacterium]
MKDRVSLRARRSFRMSGIRCALVLAIVAFGSLVAACGDSPSEEPVATPAGPSKTTKTAALPAEMVSAVSAGRSSGVVGVHFALGKLPLVGQALPVDIAIVPHQDFASVRASFEGPDGLPLNVGHELNPLTDVKSETIIKHQLVLLPRSDGVFIVSATVETESPTEGNVSRVFSLPIIVAAAAAPVAAAPAPAAPK